MVLQGRVGDIRHQTIEVYIGGFSFPLVQGICFV